MEMGHKAGIQSHLFLGLGYAHSENLDGRVTHEVVNASESGLFASLTGHFGVVSLSYRWNLSSLHGYGGIGIDIGGATQENWISSDVVMTLNSRLPYEGMLTRLRYYILPSISVFASNSYYVETLSYDSLIRENLSGWLAGLDYEWPASPLSDFMTPFVSLGAGIKRFSVVRHTADSGETTRGEVLLSEVRFSAEAAGGGAAVSKRIVTVERGGVWDRVDGRSVVC